MNYQIEVSLKNCPRPVKWDGETDDEFQVRLDQWEKHDKDKSFWRTIMLDGDGITAHHFAINSPLFPNSETGANELQKSIIQAGTAIAARHVSKNELLP